MHFHAYRTTVLLSLILWCGTAAAQWNSTTGGIYFNGGKVGIGTSAPSQALEIGGNGWLLLQNDARYCMRDNAGNVRALFYVDTANNWQYGGTAGGLGNTIFNASGVPAALVIGSGTGNVSIGMGAPSGAYKLDVNGTAHVTGNMTVDGNLAAKYQDLAEWVPSGEELAPGTVVVVDTEGANRVTASERPYDTRVAGVVSAAPGIILGVGGEGTSRVATVGRVRVRVDATCAPIRVGDLLVTSAKRGEAMKSVPVDLNGIALHRPGTLIGKALEPLAAGEGQILVLLSLQ